LRYFNAAGAYPECGLGEQHQPETHVIPLLLRAILHKTQFKIFGNNYSSKDGTCIRDYIHVRDIADAHVKAFEYIDATKNSDVFNLGTGHGYTVAELVNMAETVCESKVNIAIKDRREGDAEALVADPTKAINILEWKPEFSNLEFIVKSALAWEQLKRLEDLKKETVTASV